MNASDKLAELCAAWRQWSDREGQAIQAGDWPLVTQCQREKNRLQPCIEAHLQKVCGENGSHARAEWRAVLESLLSQESQHDALLSRQRSLLCARQDELNTASRNLRRVHASYSSQRDSHWQSYS